MLSALSATTGILISVSPMVFQHIYAIYCQYFMTLRNGVFYGVFFMALGLWFAKHPLILPFFISVAGTFFCINLMFLEVSHFHNTNFVFMAVPTTFFLFQAASGSHLKPHPVYLEFRSMSEWIYLTHFYFFYLLVWIFPFTPLSFTKVNITLTIWAVLLVFSFFMTKAVFHNVRLLKWLV